MGELTGRFEMRGLRKMGNVVAALMLVSAAACDGASQAGPDGDGSPRGTGASGPTASPTGGSAQPSPGTEVPADLRAVDYDPSFFDESSTTVDNQWFPLQPGTQYFYRGSTLEGKKRERHRIVFTVTDLTKVIDGVRTLVIWDRDYSGGELVEAELAMFAQDTAGNVWHFGQYPEEYENGRIDKTPAWVAGFEGARTGIAMKADPQPGAPSYSQGYAPAPLNWDDRARVYQADVRTCVPFACYENVLVNEEFEPAKPGAFQLKYYAPGVGNVRVGWRGPNDKDHEVVVLYDLVQLDAAALAEVRTEALALDRNGYRYADGSWGQTPPAEPLSA